jgi:hypothetical protein
MTLWIDLLERQTLPSGVFFSPKLGCTNEVDKPSGGNVSLSLVSPRKGLKRILNVNCID